MGKKRKRKNRSGKKSTTKIKIRYDEDFLSIDLKKDCQYKRRKSKLVRIRFTLVGKNWGFHYPGGSLKSKVPVIDIHRDNYRLNLRVKTSGAFILKLLHRWKEEGFSYALVIHGNSKPGGWKEFLINDSCPFNCTPFKLPDRTEHPHVTVVELS